MSTDEKNIEIICPNKLITFSDPLPLLVYCLLEISYKYERNCATVKDVAFKMRCSTPLQHSKKKEIETAMDTLCEMGFLHKDNYWGYIVDTRSFYNQTGGFEKCSYEALDLLRKDAALFRHYVLIKKGMINGKCTYSTNYFMKIENVSSSTISRRNKELVDNKLIYIYQPAIDLKEKKYDQNVYMLYSDSFKPKESFGNLNRKVAQRYNSFIKNPAKFSPLQRKELRKQVEEYNTRNPERAKDLSVFDSGIN